MGGYMDAFDAMGQEMRDREDYDDEDNLLEPDFEELVQERTLDDFDDRYTGPTFMEDDS
jgi:hypothetical protein